MKITLDWFDRTFPELYWHVAKGKLTESEPLYGAVILRGEREIGHGESDISFEDAFRIAFDSTDLPHPSNPVSA